MPDDSLTLNWRFGELTVPVRAVRKGMTWTLSATGSRETLTQADFDFTKAAKRLREVIEGKIVAHRAAARVAVGGR